MLKQKKFSATRKKFAADNVEEVLQVDVLNEDGSPVDESTLTQEQIQFCAKVASRVYRKFAASKRVMFSAEEETIQIVLPESLEDADVEVISDEILEARELEGDPGEVVAEVEETEEVVEETEEVAEEVTELEEATEEVIEETEEIQEETEEIQEENEEVIVNVEETEEEKNGEASFSAKKFSRNQAGTSLAGKVIENLIGDDSITHYKRKFFASAVSTGTQARTRR